MASDSEQDRDARVDRLVAQIVRLRESGDEVLVTELLAQHPDLADSVESFLKDQAFLEQAAKGASSDTDANEARQTEIKPQQNSNPEPTALAAGPAARTGNEEPAPSAVGSRERNVSAEPETTYVMALPAEIAAGVKPFGRYRIENLLGEGAMGAVYLAHDTQLDRKVALKTPKFNSDNAVRLSKRFRREAQSAATLHHRNICPVYDVGQIDGIDYLTMAYIEGKPLSAYVNPDKPLAQRQIALVIRKLALALQAAHDAGIVHRDLKPSNVIIDREGEPVVMDFGLAGRVDNTGSSRLTKSGTILGTPAYMAPEQIEGRQKLIGPSSDVYSLGVVMYELLSGRLPFRGSPASVMGKVLVAKPPSLKDVRPDIDPDLAGICEAMMVKHPGKRTASMVKVAEKLTAWIRASRQAEQPPQATSSKVAPPPLPAIVTTGEEMAALSKQAASRWKVDSKEISDARRTNEVKPIGWWLKTKAWFDSLPPRNRWWIAAAGAAVPLLLLLGVTFIIKIKIDDDGNVTTEVTREPPALAAGPNETTSNDIASSNAASSEPIGGRTRPAASAVGSPAFGPWITMFDGSGTSEWEHLGAFRAEGNELVANRRGAAKSRRIFEDFELEFEWKLERRGNSGVYYRAYPGAADNVWPNTQSAEFALDATDSPPAETANGALWNVLAPTTIPQIDPEQFRNAKIVCNGTEVEHWIGGMLVLKYDTSAPSFQQVLANAKNQWFKDEGPLPSGRIYLQSNVGEIRFRNIRIREIRTGAEDWRSLDGNLAAWRLQQAKSETWKPLNQLWSSDGGTLKAKRDGQHWIETIKQYRDFEFECEYRLPNPLTVGANGSGVVLRAVGKNSGGFDPKGIEVDLRPKFDEDQGIGTGCFIGYETQLQNHRGLNNGLGLGSQSRHLGWLKQPKLRSNDWNELRIRCVSQAIEVYINGELTNRGWNVPYRAGSICLRSQNTEVEFRNVRVRELTETSEPTALAAGPDSVGLASTAINRSKDNEPRPAASAVGSQEQSQPQRFLGATNARRLDVINRAAGVERGGIERLWVSSDGLEIYWQQTDWNSWKRGHQSKGGIWYARRVSHSAQWSDFRRVCTQEGMHPSVTDDGLYMICTKHPGTDTIYEASRSSKSESFSIPKPIRELRPGALVREAALKADGRWMAYAEGWMGQTKLFLSHRNSPTATWEPAKENKLNRDSKFDIGFNFPRITDDALTLWFHFGIGWPFQYVASGVKPDLSKPYDDFKYVRLNGRPLLGASAFVLPEQRQIIYTAPTKDIEDAFWEVWTADLQNDPTARTTLSSLAGKTFHIEFLSSNEGQDRAWWGNYSFTSAGEIKRDNQTVGSWREVIGHRWLAGEDGFELEFTSPSRRKSYATWITENRIVGGDGAIFSGRLIN